MTFTIKQSDTSPAIQAELKDGNYSPINLTGATVNLHMKLLGSNVVFSRTMNIVNALSGIVNYYWEVGDTDVEGTYYVEFEVTYSDLSVETFPNTGNLIILIVPELN